MEKKPKSFGDHLHLLIHEEFARSEPSSAEAKEVYARFGLAYLRSEELHRALCHLYCAFQVRSAGPVTKERIEEHLHSAFKATLGQVFSQLEPRLPGSLAARLPAALQHRNFLAHHFWYERIHLMTTVAGIEALVAELSTYGESFEDLSAELEAVLDQLLTEMGMTPEHAEKAFNQTRSGADEVYPRRVQRLPRKQETVVQVFKVPTAEGHHLVFQTEDRVLWQLCDAGLGWSPYDHPDPSWILAENFAALLPARINPRPKAESPWTFDISFGARATLCVRLEQSGPLRCVLRRTP
ncbi:MAG: hypothetical protein K2X35_22075 [Bryobacteraceae bacterium]|nr:hypothetical protein [Bryobacteraceae bacterium]